MTMILLLLALMFGLYSWMHPKEGLFILVATLPSYLLRLNIFGVPSTLLEFFVLIWIVIWIIQNRLHLRELLDLPILFKVSLIFFLLAGIINIFIPENTFSALGVFKAYLIEPVLLFLILRLGLKTKRVSATELFSCLGVSALILSLVALTQWVTGAGIPVPWDIERRVTSVFDYPNALGLFLGPITVISGLTLYHYRSARDRVVVFWSSVMILSSLAIVLAQSEAAIVSILATLALAGLACKDTRKFTLMAILLGIFLISLSPFKTFVFEKLTLQDYSGRVRLSQWDETVHMLQDRWLFGSGLSGYPVALEPYHQATHLEIFQYPHNIVLNIWVELGLLGLVATTLLGWVTLSSLTTKTNDWTKLTAILALIQMAIHGLVDVPYFKNDLALLVWIMIAIALSYDRKQSHPKTR